MDAGINVEVKPRCNRTLLEYILNQKDLDAKDADKLICWLHCDGLNAHGRTCPHLSFTIAGDTLRWVIARCMARRTVTKKGFMRNLKESLCGLCHLDRKWMLGICKDSFWRWSSSLQPVWNIVVAELPSFILPAIPLVHLSLKYAVEMHNRSIILKFELT